jgi:hypothetical protein
MDLERTFLLLNVIKRLEKIQSEYNTSEDIYNALKEEMNYLKNDANKIFVTDVCNYLVSGITYSYGLKGQLSSLLIDKNNIEIYDFCNKLLKFT